jgi:hypothetical protein
MEGLFIKAKIGCWALLGDLEPSAQSSTYERMALSIVRDLMRSNRPDLERPGALTKLVQEIEQNAGSST